MRVARRSAGGGVLENFWGELSKEHEIINKEWGIHGGVHYFVQYGKSI